MEAPASAPPSRLLLVGAPRSGLDSLAAHLRAARGIPCGHKEVFGFTPGEPTWGDRTAEASWMAVPYLPQPDAHVVLLVRHPLQVAASMVASGLTAPTSGVRHWAARRCPEIDGDHEPTLALKWWLAWNDRAVEYADQVIPLDGARPAPFDGHLPRWNVGPSHPDLTWQDFAPTVAWQCRSRFAALGCQ